VQSFLGKASVRDSRWDALQDKEVSSTGSYSYFKTSRLLSFLGKCLQNIFRVQQRRNLGSTKGLRGEYV